MIDTVVIFSKLIFLNNENNDKEQAYMSVTLAFKVVLRII